MFRRRSGNGHEALSHNATPRIGQDLRSDGSESQRDHIAPPPPTHYDNLVVSTGVGVGVGCWCGCVCKCVSS